LVVYVNGNKIHVEIKCLLSCSDLEKRIRNEIIDKVKKTNEKTLVVMIFPEWKGDNLVRINQLIEGYYILEDYINKEIGKNNISLLCKLIGQKYNSDNKFSINSFVNSLIDKINKMNENHLNLSKSI